MPELCVPSPAWLGLAWLGLAWLGLAWLGFSLVFLSLPQKTQFLHSWVGGVIALFFFYKIKFKRVWGLGGFKVYRQGKADNSNFFSIPWLGLAWFGLAWLVLPWSGLAWLGLAYPGLAWLGLAWPGLAWPLTGLAAQCTCAPANVSSCAGGLIRSSLSSVVRAMVL